MENKEYTETHGRIAEIDTVRGIACLIVVFVHLWGEISPHLPDFYRYAVYGIGKFSVLVFFFLSAYLSTRQAMHGIVPGKYLIKRFLSLYIPFVFVAIFGWMTGWISTKEELISLLDLSNITDHFWTIAVQLKFYLVFSIITSIIYFFGLKKKIVVIGLVVTSFILMHLFPQNTWVSNYQGLQWYFTIFAMGSITALIEIDIKVPNYQRIMFDILFVIFLAMIVLRIPIIRYWVFRIPMDDSLLNQYLVQGIAAGLLLFLLFQGKIFKSLFKRMRIVQLVGRASYSIYLIHYIVFSVISELNIGLLLCVVVSILSTILLSAASYLLIEKKLTLKCVQIFLQGITAC